MPLTLSPQVFAILASFIEDRTGIHYDLGDRDMVADKIATRAAQGEFESLLDYYYFLRYDPRGNDELDALVDHLVVGETYFFREVDQLRASIDLLAPILSAGGRPRLWFAAAATGEEPLTMAMLLDERGLLPRVDIVASDISLRAIERAREGVYRGRSLRALPRDASRWLMVEGDRATVRADIHRSIAWRRVNLVSREQIQMLGPFDAVVCRNVLIYFSDATTVSVIRSLTDALQPDGLLLVGASESLLRFGTSLACEEHGGAFFYRKAR